MKDYIFKFGDKVFYDEMMKCETLRDDERNKHIKKRKGVYPTYKALNNNLIQKYLNKIWNRAYKKLVFTMNAISDTDKRTESKEAKKQFIKTIESIARHINDLAKIEEEKYQEKLEKREVKGKRLRDLILEASLETYLTLNETALIWELCPSINPPPCYIQKVNGVSVFPTFYSSCKDYPSCNRKERKDNRGCPFHSSIAEGYILTFKGNLSDEAYDYLLNSKRIKSSLGDKATKNYLEDIWESVKRKLKINMYKVKENSGKRISYKHNRPREEIGHMLSVVNFSTTLKDDKQKDIFEEKFLWGSKQKDIADKVNIDQSNISRILKKLKGQFNWYKRRTHKIGDKNGKLSL
jgi:predicted DNA-binding protein YlxM (UPF0122 family)